MTGQFKAALAAIAVAALLLPTALQPGNAVLAEGSISTIVQSYRSDPFSGDCLRKKRSHLVHAYYIDELDLRVPLRCGYYKRHIDKGFGYRKLKMKHAFNLKAHRNIRKTLTSPDCVKHDALRDIYLRGSSFVHHRVVDSFRFPEGYGGRLGIVTAYWKIQSLPCADRPSGGRR